MFATHLHPLRRDGPCTFCQIEFLFLRPTHFTRAGHGQDLEGQGFGDNAPASVFFGISEQLTELLFIDDRRAAFDLRWDQGIFDCRSWITFSAQCHIIVLTTRQQPLYPHMPIFLPPEFRTVPINQEKESATNGKLIGLILGLYFADSELGQGHLEVPSFSIGVRYPL